MTNLEDIQANTSEFNIRFHLKEFVGIALMQALCFEPNRTRIEELIKADIKPAELKPTLIGAMFENVADGYLADSFDGE